MSWFVTGLCAGFTLAILLVASASGDRVSLFACRAAHPGYDCDIGWVVGEAFK